MKSVSRVFKALADPTRRQILQDLKDGELSAGEITARFPISGPSISRHLSILKGADLVEERREGNKIVYQLEPEHVAGLLSRLPEPERKRHLVRLWLRDAGRRGYRG